MPASFQLMTSTCALVAHVLQVAQASVPIFLAQAWTRDGFDENLSQSVIINIIVPLMEGVHGHNLIPFASLDYMSCKLC